MVADPSDANSTNYNDTQDPLIDIGGTCSNKFYRHSTINTNTHPIYDIRHIFFSSYKPRSLSCMLLFLAYKVIQHILCFGLLSILWPFPVSLHCTVVHCTALHCTVMQCSAMRWTVMQCTALYCDAVHCTVL